MNRTNGTGQYHAVRIGTASPGRLILMLYQGAIKALKRASVLMERKDFEGKGNALIKAQDIVMELNLALDMNAGDVSVSLRRLYLYVYRRIVEANMEMDKDAINEVTRILENLYEAWEVAVGETEGSLQTERPPTGLSVTG
jgi:flagellar protein FliS